MPARKISIVSPAGGFSTSAVTIRKSSPSRPVRDTYYEKNLQTKNTVNNVSDRAILKFCYDYLNLLQLFAKSSLFIRVYSLEFFSQTLKNANIVNFVLSL